MNKLFIGLLIFGMANAANAMSSYTCQENAEILLPPGAVVGASYNRDGQRELKLYLMGSPEERRAPIVFPKAKMTLLADSTGNAIQLDGVSTDGKIARLTINRYGQFRGTTGGKLELGADVQSLETVSRHFECERDR